ncbi:MAG: hypothetical protein VYE65_05200 [SAR324 cluster bacterium]|nr:hypothetical protein [SAR324 cluster bacterium]
MKLLRLEQPYPRSCMVNLRTNWESCFPGPAIVGIVRTGNRVRIPLLAPNISDLDPK